MKIRFIDLKAQYQALKPAIDARIHAVLEHGQFIMGPEVAELEGRLAEYVGVRHCIGASSGTDTLLIALMALGVGAGDEVITTPFSFIATSEVIALLGAKSVFVDIDPVSYCMDPALLEATITPRTKAIMPVALYGQCADMDAINAIAVRHGVPVVEDAAQSFGATYKGRRSCGLSAFGSTSFFPSKPLGAYGDGGALFTDDDALATAARQIRSHGQDRRYHHARLGINGRIDTMQAAVLLAKFDHFDWEACERTRIGARYAELLAAENAAGLIVTPAVSAGNESVFAQYTVRVKRRDDVAKLLDAAGVPTAVHYPIPLHMQPVFTDLGHREGEFPHSEAAAREVLSLPMHPYMDVQQQDFIAATLQGAVARLA
jgi:UDP-2-acetamido-2-deoxy-ribo-hexuluronate aminotransferase